MSRSMFAEAAYNGIGFGLGFAVTMHPAQTLIAGSPGEFNWGGAATTSFSRPRPMLSTPCMPARCPPGWCSSP